MVALALCLYHEDLECEEQVSESFVKMYSLLIGARILVPLYW